MARPYPCLLTNLIRVTVASVGPFDHGRFKAASTAARFVPEPGCQADERRQLAGLRLPEPLIERRYTPVGHYLSERLEQAVTPRYLLVLSNDLVKGGSFIWLKLRRWA